LNKTNGDAEAYSDANGLFDSARQAEERAGREKKDTGGPNRAREAEY